MRKTFTYEGKRYYIRGESESEIAVKIAEKKKELEKGTQLINKNTTVKKWCDEWLKVYIEPTVGKATHYAYECRIRVHITPVIGNMRLIDVRQIHLQKILNNATGQSKEHLKKIRYTLKRIFADAQRNRLISVNPAENLTLPQYTTSERRPLTDYERTHILSLCKKHKSGLWVRVMLDCGLRPQETAGLQGRHLDFKNGDIIVEQALKRMEDRIGDTKTESSVRIVPMPSDLMADLKALKIKPFEYVFKNANGNHMTEAGLRKRWKSFVYHLNIEMGCKTFRGAIVPPYRVADDLVPYTFRHTFCTDLQDAGVPINIAKDLMGHDDITTTSNIYTHKTDKAYNNAKDLLDKWHAKWHAL